MIKRATEVMPKLKENNRINDTVIKKDTFSTYTFVINFLNHQKLFREGSTETTPQLSNHRQKGVRLLTLILAESALETIPKKLWNHPMIKRYSEKHGKPPEFLLLDRSYHHTVMKSLKNNEKRGRPDIVHFALLEALASPLNKEQILQVYVHTINNYVITVNPQVRLPKNYNRFIGLMEQLFEFRKIPPTGPPLLTLKHETLPLLLQKIRPTLVLAFTTKGSFHTLEDAVAKISDEEKPVVMIGGFPHGHFSSKTLKLVDEAVSIDVEMLETWTVTSRVIYEYERAISLPKKRLSLQSPP